MTTRPRERVADTRTTVPHHGGARRPTQPGASPLIDMVAAAELLGTTPRHIRRLAQERRIPYYRIGGKVRFSAPELEAWIQSTAIRPRNPSGAWRR